MPNVTLNTGRDFSADSTTSILDAARASGIVLEYSCRTGRCGICKAPVLAGTTEMLRHEESLTQADAAEGLILTCCRSATSDVRLDIEPLDRLAGLEIKTMASRIVSIERLAVDIVKVVLKTPPTSPMRFLPGQYIDVIAEGGVRRSYSLANAPRGDGLLELIIKRYKGGTLSEYWFERAKANDLLRIEGPFGTFFLREEGPTNIVFLATGTGIAPVKALLEELAADPGRAAQHRLTVFWGNRGPESFCWDPVGLGFDVGVHYLLSGPDANWSAARGYVHDAAIRQGIDPDDTAVYACGSNAMITSAREALLALGLPAKRFFSDAFVSSN
jgi:CDP-4-dehydro-6-deoxyglucose reductase